MYLIFSDAVDALTHIYEIIVGIPETLITVILSVLYLVLYPVVCLISIVYGWIIGLIGPFIDIMHIIYDLGSSTLTSIVGIFGDAFPSLWIVLLGSIVALNVGIRLYYLLKGVSIFGWSL